MEEQIKTLTSLAILKVDLDEGFRDYLDYLVSFGLYSLDKHKPDPVTDKQLSDFLNDDFGLNIPIKGCQLVLRRLSKQGYLKKDHETFVIQKELPSVDFESKRNSASRDIELVYSRLRKYVLYEFKEEWDETKISNIILGFLGKFGIEYLRTYIFNTALPKIPPTVPKEQFIVSKFISNLYNENDPLFECISVIVKGHMYANALVCPDLESLQKKFNNLTFYFDTPIVLNQLGMHKPEEKEASEELFLLIKQLKGKVAIFEHTAIEIINILTAAEMNIENPNAESAVLREIRRIGIKRSDIILTKENLEERLTNIGIRIHDTPSYKLDYQISEKELEEAIEQLLTYRNPDALKFDINSIRSIYELRKGKVPKRLEDARAVFVTPNSLLAKAAYNVGQNHNSTKEVSSTITDYSLANIAWLKAPLGAPELPTKEMLASCYAAMEPSISLWHKYIKQIDITKDSGSISSDDHALLRVSPIAESELMNLTLGEESALTGNSIRSILDRVKANLTKEKDKEISEEKERYIAVCSARNCLEDKSKMIESNVFWLSSKLAKIIAIVVEIIGVGILALTILISTFISSPSIFQSKLIGFFAITIFCLAAFFGFLNWYLALSLKSMISEMEKAIHHKLFVFLKRILTNKRIS